MVHRPRPGLGTQEMAVATFEGLLPHVLIIRQLQALCFPMEADDRALQIAVDALETTAFHFTRRPRFYEPTRVQRDQRNYYPGLGDRTEAAEAFERLRPLWRHLRGLQDNCPPFRRDWLALDIALQGLSTAAYHFTRREHFYGSKSDSVGAVRP